MIETTNHSEKLGEPLGEQSKGGKESVGVVGCAKHTKSPTTTKEKGRPMGTAGTIALLLVGVVVVWFAVMSIFMQDRTADIWMFGYKPTFVVSNSMEPAIKTYAMCLMQRVDEESVENLEVGDIVVYRDRNGTSLIIHRLIEIRQSADGQTEYITKGDHNKYQDKFPVSAEQIKGKVVAIGNWMAPIISLFTGEKSVSSSNYDPERSKDIRVFLTILCAAIAVATILLEVRGYIDAKHNKGDEAEGQTVVEQEESWDKGGDAVETLAETDGNDGEAEPDNSKTG